MHTIKLNDLLNIPGELASGIKVKFNQHNGDVDPMEEYLRDPEIVNTRWLFWRSKQRYFSEGQTAICLLKLTYDTWLLNP